jgi:molybdenum cofactor synthesis domain-containing protein
MIELRSARRSVLNDIQRLSGHKVVLADALGCTTVEALHAPEDVPRFANSAMDGYAVRAADMAGPVRLRVVGEVRAGQGATGVVVSPGTAVRIMTGAPLPRGADTVVPVENTSSEGDIVTVVGAPPLGTFVRTPGSDVAAGQELFRAGTEVSPRVLCALAACGLEAIPVVPRLRVGVLSTGDELATVTPGDKVATTIQDANRPALLALVNQAGFEAVDLGAVRDDLRTITGSMEACAERCDALVSTGGVSVGDADYVKLAHQNLGGTTARWMQVAIKPAKPFSFALLQPSGLPAFGLAGNPVSAQVAFEMFVRPALRKMAGRAPVDALVVPARSAAPLSREPDGKLHLLRVRIRTAPGGELRVEAADGQGSHMALSMARADGLALVPDGPGVPPGEIVHVLPLDQVQCSAFCAGSGSLDDALARLGQR